MITYKQAEALASVGVYYNGIIDTIDRNDKPVQVYRFRISPKEGQLYWMPVDDSVKSAEGVLRFFTYDKHGRYYMHISTDGDIEYHIVTKYKVFAISEISLGWEPSETKPYKFGDPIEPAYYPPLLNR